MSSSPTPAPKPGSVVKNNNTFPGQAGPIITIERVDSASEAEAGSPLRALSVLRNSKTSLLFAVIVGGALGMALAIAEPPKYRATVSLEIQGVNDGFLNLRDALASSPSYDVQSQVRILQSRQLKERSVKAMSAAAPGADGVLEPPPTFASRLGIRYHMLRSQAVRSAADNVTVVSSRENRIIDVMCDAPDPTIAANFANVLAKEYVQQNREMRLEAGRRTGEWLTQTLEDLKDRLQNSEEKLREYAHTSGLSVTAEKDTGAEESLKQLQSELSRSKADRLTKEAQLTTTPGGQPDSLPDVLSDSRLNQYQVQLTELRRQLAEMLTDFTPENPKVKRLKVQIAEIQAALDRHRQNVINRVRTEFEAARRRERLLTDAYAAQDRIVAEQSGRLSHYGILKREVDSNRRLYDAMLQKVKESGLSAAMLAETIRVIDPAIPPRSPFRPSIPATTIAGIITGLFAGVVLTVLRASSDVTIQSPGDAPRFLRVPELGVIPMIKHSKPWASLIRKPMLRPSIAGRWQQAEEQRDHFQAALGMPDEAADSFRGAVVSILCSCGDVTQSKVLAFTSCSPLEGKTTVISNIAIALAEINRRVLLIDGDLRQPALHHVFDLPNSTGLTDLLKSGQINSDCPTDLLARRTSIHGLWLLTSGPGSASISNALHSPELPKLIDRFRKDFDAVLIDTPPMMLPDARILSRFADGIVFVTRAGKTHRDAAQAAITRIQEDGATVIGTVLNGWDPRTGTAAYRDSQARLYSPRVS